MSAEKQDEDLRRIAGACIAVALISTLGLVVFRLAETISPVFGGGVIGAAIAAAAVLIALRKYAQSLNRAQTPNGTMP